VNVVLVTGKKILAIKPGTFIGRYYTQHNDIQLNDTQHNGIKQTDTQHMTFSLKTISIMTFSITINKRNTQHNDTQHNGKAL
jgi:hypothetical protein